MDPSTETAPSMATTASSGSSNQPPLWMRRGTIVVLTVLVAIAVGLGLHFLLPGGWARAIGAMSRGQSAWGTGLLLGAIFTAAPVATAVLAWRQRGRSERRGRLFGFIVATIVLFAPTVLTLLIATGLTDPLRQADVILRIAAPGFTLGTLIGALGILLIGAAGQIAWRNRARRRGTPADQ